MFIVFYFFVVMFFFWLEGYIEVFFRVVFGKQVLVLKYIKWYFLVGISYWVVVLLSFRVVFFFYGKENVRVILSQFFRLLFGFFYNGVYSRDNSGFGVIGIGGYCDDSW